MSIETEHLVVDRMESGVVVLVTDSGEIMEVPREELPPGTRSGSVLRVSRRPDGDFDWTSAVLDSAEEERRLVRAREILKELKERDPGGDIVL